MMKILCNFWTFLKEIQGNKYFNDNKKEHNDLTTKMRIDTQYNQNEVSKIKRTQKQK